MELNPPERVSFRKIKQQAAVRGMSVSQYVADLLAIQAGHPELVREGGFAAGDVDDAPGASIFRLT